MDVLHLNLCTGVELFIGSKVYFEICTPEGRGGEKRGNANFKIKHTEPLTQEITPPCTPLALAKLLAT